MYSIGHFKGDISPLFGLDLVAPSCWSGYAAFNLHHDPIWQVKQGLATRGYLPGDGSLVSAKLEALIEVASVASSFLSFGVPASQDLQTLLNYVGSTHVVWHESVVANVETILYAMRPIAPLSISADSKSKQIKANQSK